jgi:hypothetical protein
MDDNNIRQSNQQLQDKIRALKQEKAEVQATNTALDDTIQQLQAANAALQATVQQHPHPMISIFWTVTSVFMVLALLCLLVTVSLFLPALNDIKQACTLQPLHTVATLSAILRELKD